MNKVVTIQQDTLLAQVNRRDLVTVYSGQYKSTYEVVSNHNGVLTLRYPSHWVMATWRWRRCRWWMKNHLRLA